MTGLVHPDGTPLRRAVRAGAYDAADHGSQELAAWWPSIGAPDTEYSDSRDTVVARVRDQVRNDPWATGAVKREIDNVIGADLRLSAQPDYRALGLDADWAADFARQAETAWRSAAYDVRLLFDVTRTQTWGELMLLAYRHFVIDGEALAVLRWRPDRGGYATCVQIVDPDRLSNPQEQADTETLRGGIGFNADGAPVRYHIRRRHPADYVGMSDFRWTAVRRETEWGRPVCLHYFERLRAGQTRGVSAFAPVIKRLRMLARYDEAELAQALLSAILGAFVESPYDHEMVAQAISEDGSPVNDYQRLRKQFHDDRRYTLNGVGLPMLFPGEKIGWHTAQRPSQGFAPFQATFLRSLASSRGMSYEQVSADWSQTNYSSARGALVEAWKSLGAGRQRFCQRMATPIYAAVLEEAIDRGDVELPAGAPDYQDARTAYARCRWIGPGRGWVDPVKEAQAAQIRMAICVSTLENEAADQGLDYQEIIAQRAREMREWQAAGLADPNMLAIMSAGAPSDRAGQ